MTGLLCYQCQELTRCLHYWSSYTFTSLHHHYVSPRDEALGKHRLEKEILGTLPNTFHC